MFDTDPDQMQRRLSQWVQGFAPAMLNPLQHIGVAALNSSAKCLNATATNVRDAAEDYAEIDDYNTLASHRMGGTWIDVGEPFSTLQDALDRRAPR